MPRYFFNIHNDDGVDLYDGTGLCCDGRAEIHSRMVSMAIDLVDGMRLDDRPWLVEVLDEAGKIVYSMDIAIEQEYVPRAVLSGTIRANQDSGSPAIQSFRSEYFKRSLRSSADGQQPTETSVSRKRLEGRS